MHKRENLFNNYKSPSSGFTLLELQVAIFILMLAVTGLSLIFKNYTRQLQWLERKRSLYAVIVPSPNDVSKVIFTEYKSGLTNSQIVYKVTVQSLTEDANSVTAVALMEAK